MGLFDDIKVNYKLPELVELKGCLLTQDVVQNASYQTKDLECCMKDYTIHEDGTITNAEYETNEWVKDKDAFMGGYIHGTNLQHIPLQGNHAFVFYTFFSFDQGDYDYDIHWKAVVLDGKIHSIQLHEFNSESNNERLKHLDEWNRVNAERKRYYRSIEYKYFFKYTDAIINGFAKVLLKVTNFVISMCNKLNRLLYKLRR